MPALLIYLVKLSCSLGLLWLFYRLVLHNLTFYTLNRWYLLGYALLSFVIPFIDIGPIRGEDPAHQPLIIQYIPVIGRTVDAATLPTARSSSWDPWYSLLVLFALGSALLLVRLAIRCYSLRQMRRNAMLLEEGPVKIFRVQRPIAPFSFGNAIYVNPEQHTEKEWEEIILHEYVHIRQRHTIDILLAEFLVIMNWYNPFAWLIRYSIRQNLEFIADRAVVENGVDKKGYQYHLLKVVGQSRYRIANNFNFSSLKKRIIMMNKMQSARLHLLRFLFILPLLTVLLVAFRDRFPLHHTPGHLYLNVAGIVISLPNKAPLSGVVVREKFTGILTVTDANGYYKLKIPARKDSVDIHLDFMRQGYKDTYAERFWPALAQTTGLCYVAAMGSFPSTSHEIFVVAPDFTTGLTPADPGYEDAFHALQQILQTNDALNHFMAVEKAHPEIGLWYVTEDKRRRILVHTDGTAERYGYPGAPSLADMDARYGALPDYMVKNTQPVNNGYLSRWADIAAQAGKEFHTTAAGIRAIIFPGDSRVIAVPAFGSPQVYDMDNDDPRERPAFEKLYGPLPACVPASSHYSTAGNHPPAVPANPRYETRPATSVRSITDTFPHKPDTTKDGLHWGVTNPDYYKALWIVDGEIKPKGWYDSIRPNTIAAMNIYSGEEAKRIFGEQGANGVFYIITKAPQRNIPLVVRDHPKREQPLYIVDGNPVNYNALDSLDPSKIQSVTVARSSVVLIQTKNASHPHIVMDTKDADGHPWKITADSFHTPQGDFHIENPKPNR